ncbi:MAG: 50S ribosomal protein L11 methyltransferase [Bacteroidales bacterium]
MSTMDYVEVTAVVEPVQPWADLLITEMAEIGFESFEENLKGFKAYIQSDAFDEKKLSSITIPEMNADGAKFSFTVKKIDNQNWNQVWESNFEPVDVKQKCYIRAPFHKPKPDYPWEVIIEPKMSFGTGHHETTSLMVEWMLETDFKGKHVLDMGCGTGILAILASKMGAGPVVAIDNYPFAWENTLENVKRNDTPDISVLLGDVSLLGKENYDIILANITKNVLMEDIEVYASVLNPKGELYISGFFADDMQDIIQKAEKHSIKEVEYKQNKEWVAVKLVKI